MRPLTARLRSHGESRSIGWAICVLFLLTSIIGTFASGAAAAEAIDDGGVEWGHCLSGADVGDGERDDIVNCCVLGCPMVGAALPCPDVPAAIGISIAGDEAIPVLPTAPPCHPAGRVKGDGPRGPPILV